VSPRYAAATDSKEHFLQFAWNFVDNTSKQFFEISKEDQPRCKKFPFPAGFHIDANKIVYTPEISPLLQFSGHRGHPDWRTFRGAAPPTATPDNYPALII
jgi:hypothetical protein